MIRISLLHPDLLSKLLSPAQFAARLPDAWRDRFVSKIDFSGECWLWTRSKCSDGYGTFRLATKTRGAHQVAFEFAIGPVAPKLELDHIAGLCTSRACVRPYHMQPTTHLKNIYRGNGWVGRNARKPSCPRGHEYAIRTHGPGRRCVECDTASQKRWKTDPANKARIASYRNTDDARRKRRAYRARNADTINANKRERYRSRKTQA